MKILCTICMRSGSKGVKNKNFKLLNGKPMMVFKTEDNSRLTINPSFHTFTLEELPYPQPEDLGVLTIKGEPNG